jgi:hypothetical protein
VNFLDSQRLKECEAWRSERQREKKDDLLIEALKNSEMCKQTAESWCVQTVKTSQKTKRPL